LEQHSERAQPSASIRRVPRSQTHTHFDPHSRPALVAGRGETIVLETQDCFYGQVTEDPQSHRHIDASEHIPLTGPVYVEGAEVGDVLCVHILNITVASSGIALIRPKTGILGREIRRPVVRLTSIQKDKVLLVDGITLPLLPVIGNIGVAPRHGQIAAMYPGRHGGNMDTLDITAGTRVLLPVQVKGALLSVGDVKACMGDGQACGAGVEVAAAVTVRIDTLPGGRFSWPRIKTKDDWITVASASSVDQAARLAVMEMIKWLEQEKGLDFETAYMMVGLSGALRISQWGNPLVTARVVFPKSIAKKLPTRLASPARTILFTHLPDTEEAEKTVSADSEGEEAPAPAEAIPSEETGRLEQEDNAPEEGQEERPAAARRPRRWRRRRHGSSRGAPHKTEKSRKEGDTEPAPDTEARDQAARLPASEPSTDRPERTRPADSGALSPEMQPPADRDESAGQPRKRPAKWRPRRRRSPRAASHPPQAGQPPQEDRDTGPSHGEEE
jgi:amidase